MKQTIASLFTCAFLALSAGALGAACGGVEDDSSIEDESALTVEDLDPLGDGRVTYDPSAGQTFRASWQSPDGTDAQKNAFKARCSASGGSIDSATQNCNCGDNKTCDEVMRLHGYNRF